jgi:hypothetical protein
MYVHVGIRYKSYTGAGAAAANDGCTKTQIEKLKQRLKKLEI